MEPLKIGVSTCPNDTFIFGAILRGEVKFPRAFTGIMDDVQLLNGLAMDNALDMVKVSFGVFPEISDNYKILRAGGALGFGCGPLLLSEKFSDPSELEGKKIAVPGLNTTAFKVFSLFFPKCLGNIVPARFDSIMPGIASGEYDAGLVIHEGRFTYESYGLRKLADLGVLWEKSFDLPIPLGFIALKKDLEFMANEINDAIRASLEFARRNPAAAYDYAKKYALDMRQDVMKSHVGLYVNDFSVDSLPAADAVSKLLGTDLSVFC